MKSMKKAAFFGLMVLSIFFFACEDKFENGEFVPVDVLYTDSIDIPSPGEIGKKGIFLLQNGSDWSAKVSSIKPHWHYSEASKLSIKEPGNVDFVPMIANTSDMSPEIMEDLSKMKDKGNLRYLIGFNEPDNPEKANLSVTEAIELWPMLEQFDVPLSSPLCQDFSNGWLDQFMQEVDAQGLRVDYISVQWAGGDDLDAFFSHMENISNKYNRPVWITKFTLVNTKLKKVLEFLEAALPELENTEHIFRYAFQSGSINTGTALWDDLGYLTTRGQLYSGHKSNSLISNGRDDRIDFSALQNLIVNGGFETGDLTGWQESYGNEMVENDANSGQFSGKGIATGWGSSFNQIFEVVPLANYYLSFSCKFLEPITAPEYFLTGLAMALKDNATNEKFHDTGRLNSTDWSTMSEQITIPEGVTEIKVIMWRPQHSPEHLLDDVFFAKVE